MLIAFFSRWFTRNTARTIARHRAIRHMAVIAHAIYTGSTAAYELTPDLPRQVDSSNVDF